MTHAYGCVSAGVASADDGGDWSEEARLLFQQLTHEKVFTAITEFPHTDFNSNTDVSPANSAVCSLADVRAASGPEQLIAMYMYSSLFVVLFYRCMNHCSRYSKISCAGFLLRILDTFVH